MKRARYPIQRYPKTNWILGPIHQCIEFMAVEKAMGNAIVRAVELIPLIPGLVRLAGPELVKKFGSQAVGTLRTFNSETVELAKWLEELAEDDFALVNAHALVALWSGIETCVENIVVIALVNDQSIVEAAKAEVKVLKGPGIPGEPEARAAFRSLERKARQKEQGVLRAYDWLLELVGVPRDPGSDLSLAFDEINAVRNCILHLAGTADQRTVDAAPRLELNVGAEVRISREQLDFYYDVMGTFTVELSRGATRSRHVRSKEQLNTSGD